MASVSNTGFQGVFLAGNEKSRRALSSQRIALVLLALGIIAVALTTVMLAKNKTKPQALHSIDSGQAAQVSNEPAPAPPQESTPAVVSNVSVQSSSQNSSSSNTSSTSINVNGQTYQTNSTNFDKTVSNNGSTVHISQHSTSSGAGG